MQVSSTSTSALPMTSSATQNICGNEGADHHGTFAPCHFPDPCTTERRTIAPTCPAQQGRIQSPADRAQSAGAHLGKRGSQPLQNGRSQAEVPYPAKPLPNHWPRSEEHTSELQSHMRNSYAVFCLK